MSKSGFLEGVLIPKCLLTKKTKNVSRIKTSLTYTRLFLENTLQTFKTELEFLVVVKSSQKKNIVLKVKHGSGTMMACDCLQSACCNCLKHESYYLSENAEEEHLVKLKRKLIIFVFGLVKVQTYKCGRDAYDITLNWIFTRKVTSISGWT